MAERILLIEDDRELGAQIVEHLKTAGFDAVWWKEGRHLEPRAQPAVSLVILDLMLPGTYGMDILKELRTHSEVPVMVLSARNDTFDRIHSLQLGADDYMTKPFWPEELVERVRARLRRPTLARGAVVEVGPLRIDLASHEVHVRGERVELTRVEFDFLAMLAERPGAALTRRRLAERVL